MSDKESKHTAGPWVVFTPEDHEGQSDSRTLGIDSADGIAVVWYGDGPETGIPNDADARLIAAAPDLLDLATALLSAIEMFAITNTSDEDTIGVLSDAAREVIDKAQGAA